jgi:tRNA splicing endonuclease
MKKITAHLVNSIVSSVDSEAFTLYEKSRFGEKMGEKIIYTLPEAMFLVEKEKMEIFLRNKKLQKKDVENKFNAIDRKFHTRYVVFKDLREKAIL